MREGGKENKRKLSPASRSTTTAVVQKHCRCHLSESEFCLFQICTQTQNLLGCDAEKNSGTETEYMVFKVYIIYKYL